MRFIIAILVILFLFAVLFCGAGIGIGALIHWIIPSISLEIGALIGVVAVAWSGWLYGRITNFAESLAEDDEVEIGHSEIGAIVLKPLQHRKSSKRKRT